MAPPLSLHQLTLLDVPPETLIDIAAVQGCEHVCVFVVVPDELAFRFPAIGDSARAAVLRRRLDDAGISVWNLEAFHLTPKFDPSVYRSACERGAILGGRGATVINFDPDPASAVDGLGRFAAMAREYGIKLGLEWIRPSETRTLAAARHLVQQCATANLALTIDPLHLYRNGGTAAEVAALPPHMVGYVQICDGPAYLPEDAMWHEMIAERSLPGEGEFPLVEYLRALPRVPVLAVEIPRESRWRQSSPGERAAQAITATRKIWEQAGRCC